MSDRSHQVHHLSMKHISAFITEANRVELSVEDMLVGVENMTVIGVALIAGLRGGDNRERYAQEVIDSMLTASHERLQEYFRSGRAGPVTEGGR